MPREFSPQLATLSAEAPRGERWLHELKFDGYRLLAFLRDGKARLVTRRGNDWTHRFRSIADALESLPVERAILDGEVVSLNERGISDFQQLQNQLKRGDEATLAYYLFDLPYYDGYSLTDTPLLERKLLLERVLTEQLAATRSTLRYSEHIEGEGDEVLTQACKNGLEGIISKRIDGHYVQTRSPAWLKSKCTKRQEFVIGGYTKPAGARSHFGALLLGYYDGDGRLAYAGKVGTGFTQQSLQDVFRELKKRVVDSAPFADPPRGYEARSVAWVKPELVGEVEFTEWTKDGQLRHPSFQGLREDKSARSIVREEVREMAAKTAKKKSEDASVAGVSITHPERVVYPGYGITKLDVARYYENVAKWIMPYVEGRPLTLVRCPQGQARQCFYQKHLTDAMPAAVHGVMIQEKDAEDEYVAVSDVAGLVALVQLGALEFHPWPAREDKVERPDMLVFDLDPGEGVDWKSVVQGANDVRDCLEALGLVSFLRTSGGKGLHVVAPLARRNSWDDLKEFSRGVAETMVRAAPERYVANMSKAKRRGKIFVDYLRNQRGATAIASYSTRARTGAPIATPLAWEELTARIKPDQFTLQNIDKRLAKGFKDPWKDFFKIKQSITRKMLTGAQG